MTSSARYRSIGRPSTASTTPPSTRQPLDGWYAASVPGTQAAGAATVAANASANVTSRS